MAAGNFKARRTKILEQRNIETLGLAGLTATVNNGVRITDTDFICEGHICDFQYSCNFDKYGDVRIDLISAYQSSDTSREHLQQAIKDNLLPGLGGDLIAYLGTFMQIQKLGKFFQPSNQKPVSVVYWFFNGPEKDLDPVKDNPVAIYSASTEAITGYVQRSWREIVKRGHIKLNDKSRLGDRHGSAFIPLNVQLLHRLGVLQRHEDYEELSEMT